METPPNGSITNNKDHDPWKVTEEMLNLEREDVNHSTPLEIAFAHHEIAHQKPVDFILVSVDTRNPIHNEKREIFERALREQGLQLEYEHNEQLCFIKIFASREVLCRYCEIMKLRMPIRHLPDDDVIEDVSVFLEDAKSWFIKLFKFARLDWKKFPLRKSQLAAEFSRDKDYLFDVDNENFFPTYIRVMIVDFILERQSEGIQRLLAEGVYSAAYPLHDGSYKDKHTTRGLLYEEWGRVNKWLKLQPLDVIQEYFGVNFAIYFSWLGFYTYMLIPASIAGLICFFYGLVTLTSNQLAKDTCAEWADNVIMCPQCDRNCDFWKLNETCMLARLTHLFDNPATLVFGVFMSFWSILYLEMWRRRSMELSYRWGLVGWDSTAEHPRPQYLSVLSNPKMFKVKEKVNTVTREREPHVSFWKVRVPATFLSFSIVILLASVAVAAVFAVVLYRMSKITSNTLFGKEFDSASYKTFALPAFAAGINLVCILILNYLYDWVARYLTEMELLRTQSEFDDSLTLKIYLFQFVNYYASIFYIAFLKGKFVGYPKKYIRIFGYRQEECSPGGCLMELCIQLVIIMVGKQAVYTALEMIWPIMFKWWALFRIHTGLKRKDPIVPSNQWTRDFKLLDWSPRGLYDEYLEMVIQFGFITLFVVAFPLAPVFALANNVLEMRLDATKFLRHFRRPVPRRARDIGIWARILDALARISVMTNAFIIAFSSNLIPRLVYIEAVSSNSTDVGFLDNSLAYFNTSDFEDNTAPIVTEFENVTICRYAEYRNPPDHETDPYERPALYWHILAARLAFVVVYQNIVGLLTMAVQWCLSGSSRKLRDRIKREAFLTEELVIKRESERAQERLRAQSLIETNSDTDDSHLRQRNTAIYQDTPFHWIWYVCIIYIDVPIFRDIYFKPLVYRCCRKNKDDK